MIGQPGSHPTAEPEVVVVMRMGRGPLSLQAHCRVVYPVQEPNVHGFAYGTLLGRPETGPLIAGLFWPAARQHLTGSTTCVSQACL